MGIYSIGLYGSEAIWNIGKSVSIVQFSKIANDDNKEASKTLTIKLLHLVFFSSLILVLIAALIPENLYQWIFGSQIVGVQRLMQILGIGILANACNGVIAHYFSGIGKPLYNVLPSLLALIGLVAVSFWLIPDIGIEGAAIAATCAFIIQFIVMALSFIKVSKAKLWEFIPNSQTLKF
ncbi:MAG: polysaccharide biosynthesis C-terminal domain-containing protein [Flavobacteriales bacterium]|nr:polysaccharide biosynthesis C-terminal domain-containing protein [Flavobacteriales bacterium]